MQMLLNMNKMPVLPTFDRISHIYRVGITTFDVYMGKNRDGVTDLTDFCIKKSDIANFDEILHI